MAHHDPQPQDELQAIDRNRMWIVLTSVLAILVLAVTLLQAPTSAFVVATIIIAIALKKAFVQYRILGVRKTTLLYALGPTPDTEA